MVSRVPPAPASSGWDATIGDEWRQLAPREADALTRIYRHGHTQRQAAAAIGVSADEMRVIVSRALQTLGRLLCAAPPADTEMDGDPRTIRAGSQVAI